MMIPHSSRASGIWAILGFGHDLRATAMPQDSGTHTDFEPQTAIKASVARASSVSRGTNQSGVRLYNERLILSLVRRHGSVPKVEIARVTGLSVQTATGIVKSLQRDGLLLAQSPQRGRVGQPAVPFALNPDGAFSIGLKIGRRSCDLVLVDFVGSVRLLRRRAYAYPIPHEIVAFVEQAIGALVQALSEETRERIAGLGVALPFELWNWEYEVGAPVATMSQWREIDIQSLIAAVCPWPVTLCNDATAACAAEVFFGDGWRYRDFIYFFIGSFIGGGIVLNGSLYPGRTGNAGAVGSMPIGRPDSDGGVINQQLIRTASTYVLANRLNEAGIDPSSIWQTPEHWDEFGPTLEQWTDEVAAGLAIATIAAASVIDFEAAIIEGACPAVVRAIIVAKARDRVIELDRRGLSPFVVEEGSIGVDARPVGAAALPLLAHFARDREVLFKEIASAEGN
jgi:predicted NBD/HSP70 family sugar kinase